MVPYRDFIEGNGKYWRELKEITGTLRIRSSNEGFKFELLGNSDADDEEVDKCLEMMQSAGLIYSQDEESDAPADNELETEDETPTELPSMEVF